MMTRYRLANSTVSLEAERFAWIERDDGSKDVAGPLPLPTIQALREVAE